LTTHKQFDEKMALKTIYNSGCQKVINSTPDNNSVHIDDEDPTKPIVEDDVMVDTTEHFDDFEEVVEEPKEVVDEQPKEEPQQPTQEQPSDDEF
jgi:recombinational DNA repair protein RecT